MTNPEQKAARELLDWTAGAVQALPHRPGLAVLLLEEGPESRPFSDALERDADACGVYCESYAFPAPLREEAMELRTLLADREDLHWTILLPGTQPDWSALLPAGAAARLDRCALAPEALSALTPADPLFRAILLAVTAGRAGASD